MTSIHAKATNDMYLVSDQEHRARLEKALLHLRTTSGRIREPEPGEPSVILEVTLADLIEEILHGR